MTGVPVQKEMKDKILKYRAAGRTVEEITALLHADGFVSHYTGKPYSTAAVAYHAARLKRKRKYVRKAPIESAAPKPAKNDPFEAIRALLTAKSIPPQKRIDLALMVMK